MEIGKSGRGAIDRSIIALDSLKHRIESTAENILQLVEQAQAIGEIITTVNEIAEQTNLLARNAAIEASRAGEYGKGFSVVASEVKLLADQSKASTVQVRRILGEIQKAINAAVLSTEEVSKGMQSTTEATGQAGQTIKARWQETLNDTAQAAAQIMASTNQQATGMSQINQAMHNIEHVTRENLTATSEAEHAAHTLKELGTQLACASAGNRQLAVGSKDEQPTANCLLPTADWHKTCFSFRGSEHERRKSCQRP